MRERDFFIEQLALLVSSGMPLLSGLDVLSHEVRSRRMRRVLAFLRRRIDEGSPMHRALEEVSLFPQSVVQLIKIGEVSGRLKENMRIAALQQERDRVFQSKIRGALVYPAVVACVAVIVSGGIAWFIFPKLATVFEQLRIELPPLTKLFIACASFLSAYGTIITPVVGVFVFAIVYFLAIHPRTRLVGKTIAHSLPGIGRLLQEIEIARCGYLLGTLLCAGIPIVPALDSLEQSTELPRYRRLYAHLKKNIDEGLSFKKSFAAYQHSINRLLPLSIQHLIVVGEESGSLAECFLTISARYDSQSEMTSKNVTTIMEPLLLLIVWIGVIFVALAVILPIYSIVGGLDIQ